MEKPKEKKTKRVNKLKRQKVEKKKIVYAVITGIFILAAGAVVGDMFSASGRLRRMEERRRERSGRPVLVDSCRIEEDGSSVTLSVSAETIPDSEDGCYYVFSLEPYEEEVPVEAVPLAEGPAERKVEFWLKFQQESDIRHKFVVAVKRNGEYEMVSIPHYVTNLEALAVFTSNGETPAGKKGLLIDPDKLLTQELDELGIKHAAYNIPLSRILGQPEDEVYPAVHYTYEGKDYVFNGRVMAEYDLIFRTLTEKGIQITAIILNDVSENYPWLIHPWSRSGIGKPPYYAFNASDEEGTEYLAAIGSFLAERYSGVMNGRGVVANWVIGNEINARKEWNYMEHVDLDLYVREYVRAYRVFYQSIKSINRACGVYISLDNQWNRVNILTQSYRAKDVLDEFSRQMKEEGDVEWGLAIHPYNKPLGRVHTWKSSVYVKDTENTPVVSMANIQTVTDYMQQEEFLTGQGEVRSIIISELGYTSSKGEELQAAAILYAYRMAEANEHIDSILFSRQTDAEVEIRKLRLYLGLDGIDGAHKYAYDVFRYMDTKEAEKYTGFAETMWE